MTNKDCIHDDVCKFGSDNLNGAYCTGEKCKRFKDKSRYVQQSEGEWKALTSICFDYICTNCGEPAITYEDQNYTECYHLTKFCPNCGAKMKGGAK